MFKNGDRITIKPILKRYVPIEKWNVIVIEGSLRDYLVETEEGIIFRIDARSYYNEKTLEGYSLNDGDTALRYDASKGELVYSVCLNGDEKCGVVYTDNMQSAISEVCSRLKEV